jgi:signal transduction histidine kinase
VTGERSTRLRLAAQNGAVRALVAADSPEAATVELLREVCQNLRWTVGAYWCPTEDDGALELEALWSDPDADVTAFVEASRATALRRGTPLPGRVWATGEPAWIPDLADEPEFARAGPARKGQLHGGFAVPVPLAPDRRGVLEFYTRQPMDLDTELLDTMMSVGRYLGQFVQRRRAEAALWHTEAQYRFLAEAGQVLASSLDYGTTLRSVATLAVPYLGDGCLVHVRDSEGRLVTPVARVAPGREMAPAEALEALLTGNDDVLRPVLEGGTLRIGPGSGHTGLAEHLAQLGLASILAVPLRARGDAMGVITFANRLARRPHDRVDASVAEELGRRAGLAIDNARLYREAEEGNRAKADFLAVVSHELRTPLNAIAGYADLLSAEISGTLTDGQRRHVERIKVGAGHLAHLIDEILSYARVETGRETLILEPTNLGRVAREAARGSEADAHDKGLVLEVDLPEDGPWLLTDPGKARQILINLVNNAVKYTETGRVRLTVGSVEGGAVAQVEDTGIGIESEDRERIFEPFWQAQSPNTRSVGGTGIGLSVSRRLARLLEGDVEVESEPGHGSTFTVRLPDLTS